MIDRVGDAEHLAIERVDGRGESIRARLGPSVSNGTGLDARREPAERVEPAACR